MARETESPHVDEKPHPGTRTYVIIAVLLSVTTAFEVWVFYWDFTAAFIAALILLTSAFKFALVVGYYMHLRFDDRRFLAFFVAPFIIAVSILVALISLFSNITR